MLKDLYSTGRWLIAKYHSTCQCGNQLKPGDDLWYVPYKKKPYCYQCGTKSYPKELKQLLGIDNL